MNSKLPFLSRLLSTGAALLLAAPSPAIAQSANAQASRAYNFHFSITAFAPGKTEMGSLENAVNLDIEGVSYETGGVVRPLGAIPFQTRSNSFLYRGDNALSFFREESDANGEPVRKVLAEVTPDRSWRSVLLLAFPNDQGGTKGFRVEALPDDPRAFPEHSVLVANRSNVEIALVLEGQRHVIAAGAHLLLPMTVTAPRMLPMQFFTPERIGKRPTYSTSLPLRPGQRLLVLLQGDARTTLRLPPVFLFDAPKAAQYDSFDPEKRSNP